MDIRYALALLFVVLGGGIMGSVATSKKTLVLVCLADALLIIAGVLIGFKRPRCSDKDLRGLIEKG